MSFLTRPLAVFGAHRRTIFVWAAIIIAFIGITDYNRSTQAHTIALLSSANEATRDNAVQGLVQNGHLTDVLSATQDPNSDVLSPQNIASVTLRENAAASVNRLIAAHRVGNTQAMDTLFMLRKDSDKPVRDTATAGLATLGAASGQNLKALVAGLRNGDPDIRSAAVDALGKVGGDQSAKLIDPLTQDQDASDSALSAMQKVGAPSAPYLLARLGTTRRDFKQKVIVTLGAIGSPLSVPALLQIAASPDLSYHRLAVSALANTVLNDFTAVQKAQLAARTAAAVPNAKANDIAAARDAALKAQATFAQTSPAAPALVASVENPEDDSQARTQATLALGRLGGTAAVAALVRALGDYDALVRSAAGQGLQSAGAQAVPALTEALRQGTVQTQAAVAQALGSIGSPASLGVLTALVGNTATSPSVRRAAVMGMGQSGSMAYVPVLVSALGDPDGTVASAASDALISPALEAAAVPALVASLGRPDPVPFNASQALARMGTLAVPALRTAAGQPNPRVQTWAAVALGETDSKDPAITASLTPLTTSSSPTVQYAARQALSRLAGI